MYFLGEALNFMCKNIKSLCCEKIKDNLGNTYKSSPDAIFIIKLWKGEEKSRVDPFATNT